MNDAQTWTTVGGLFTIMFAFMALIVRMFSHTLDAKFAAVDARFESLTNVMTEGFRRIDKQFEQVDKRFEQVDKRFEQVDKRFEQVEKRLDRIEDRVDNLDRDVHAITRRLMDGPDQA